MLSVLIEVEAVIVRAVTTVVGAVEVEMRATVAVIVVVLGALASILGAVKIEVQFVAYM